MDTNEPIISHRKVVAGSNRSFGLVFAAVLTVIGAGPALFSGAVRWWAIGLGALFLAAALLAPAILAPLNRAWFKLGLALHYVVNPIVMGLVYYVTVVPMGLVLRALGKDLLRLRRDTQAATYWISREPPGPGRGSMSKQF